MNFTRSRIQKLIALVLLLAVVITIVLVIDDTTIDNPMKTLSQTEIKVHISNRNSVDRDGEVPIEGSTEGENIGVATDTSSTSTFTSSSSSLQTSSSTAADGEYQNPLISSIPLSSSTIPLPEQQQQQQGPKEASPQLNVYENMKYTHNHETYVVDESIAEQFTSEFCDLQGTEWYPTNSSDKSWQLRTPYVLISGVQHTIDPSTLNDGAYFHDDATRILAYYLSQHEQIVEPKLTWEPHFFSNTNFRKFITTPSTTTSSSSSNSTTSTTTPKTITKVLQARTKLYAQHYKTIPIQSNRSKIAFDATPNALYVRSVDPEKVLCVLPWIKMVVVLTNPVDRLYYNWLDATRKRMLKVTFEDWVSNDLDIMYRVNLISRQQPSTNTENNNNNNRKLQETQTQAQTQPVVVDEYQAWMDYQFETLEGGVGQSMYEIQLRYWFEAFKKVGKKDLKQYIHIIKSEDLLSSPQQVYTNVLQFLGLSTSSSITNKVSFIEKLSTSTTQTQSNNMMSTETRTHLQQFFAPYNQKLYKLLNEEYGGVNWDGYLD